MGTESIGSCSFPVANLVSKAKTFLSLFVRKTTAKLFEILTLKLNQRVTTKIDLWVIVSSFFIMRHN